MSDPRTGPRPAHILLVEDNEDHAFLAMEAFERGRLSVDVRRVENGVQCMEFLRREGEYADAPSVDFVLLDIHLPLMDGYAVIAAIRQDPGLRALPVVVMSTSREDLGVRRMYELGCNSYIAKPVNFANFVELLAVLGDYWLQVVVLPPAG